MIGVDTNVLVRLFVPDDPEQGEVAARFFRQRSPDNPAFVSCVVVAELIWVLDKSYGYSSSAIHNALSKLFESANIVVERSLAVQTAIANAKAANAGFTDGLVAAVAVDFGASSVATFDRKAAKRVRGMELLT